MIFSEIQTMTKQPPQRQLTTPHRKLVNYQYIPLYIYVRFPPKPVVFTIKNLSLWTKDRTTANN